MSDNSCPPLPEIPGYELSHVLGSGGMGTVYAGLDGDGHAVAIKVLHPGLAADAEVRARLRREVATLHRVRGSHAAQVLDAELDAAQAFIVTELIDGEDLSTSIARHGEMDSAELAQLATGLAAALSSIHAASVVHRDLKPGNVMLTDDGPVLIDFGISQVMDDARLTRTGMVTGTPGYVDPVVLSGAQPDELGDWWGWAALLVFAATGRPPFGTGPLQAVLARTATGGVDVDGLPEPTRAALTAALSPTPQQRLAPAQVVEVLGAVATGAPVPAIRLPAAPPQQAPPQVSPPWAAPPSQPQNQPPRIHPGGGYGTQVPLPPTYRPGQTRQGVVESWPVLPPEPPVAVAAAPRARPAPTGLWWIAATVLAALRPGWVSIWFVAVVIVCAMFGSAGRELRKRRNWYGRRRRDLALAWVSSPVHLLLGALRSVPGIIVGGIAGVLTWIAVSSVADVTATSAAAAGIAMFVYWWMPSSGSAREGARAIFGVGGARSAQLWTILAGIAIVAALALLATGSAVAWDPWPTPPMVSDVS